MDKENKVRKADGIVVSMGDGNDVVVTIPVKIPVLEVMGDRMFYATQKKYFMSKTT